MLQGFSKTMMTGAALLCLIGVTNTAKADAAACPATIPFGLTTPLTGNLALLGTQARNGAEFAVDEINAAGGIAGKKIALTTEDTGASSTDALNAMNRIIESKPLVIMSSMISPHVLHRPRASTSPRPRSSSAPPTRKSPRRARSGCSAPTPMTASSPS